MWWAGTDPVHVLLGQSFVAVRVGSAPARWSASTSPVTGWEWVTQTLRSDKRVTDRMMKPQVWLSGGLARPFVLPALAGLRDVDEAIEIASHMASEQTGLDGPCCVTLTSWARGSSCLAAAMCRDVRDLLMAASASGGIRAKAIRPWWAAVLNQAIAGREARNCWP